VSEYQYYEFRALDRRLTAEQQQRLRSLSSRAEISATRLANEYSFGNFRGDPGRLLEEYFDAYLYAANWGTRELALRLPRALLDAQTAQRYCDEEHRAWVTETAEHVIVRFRWDDDEGDDWIEGDGLLDPLLAARGELATGDLRLLYLGWLLKVQLGELKFLTMVAEGEGAQVEALLVRRSRWESRPAGTTPASTGRTAGELLAAAEARRAAREQAEAQAKEEARARRAAEQAAAYERHLQNLTGRKEETWQQVAELTVFSKPKEYDQATQLLCDLHVITQREDDITAFTERVRELRTRYAKRPSVMDRLDKAGLP
jgi:hypothetical protein